LSERIWLFQGELQENGKRVLTEAESNFIEINEDEKPELNVSSDRGKLIIDLKLPAQKKITTTSIGKQYTVDGSDKNAAGQTYGEIFNDYINNTAKGIFSHVTGYKNKGEYPYQIVFGKYNQNKEENVLEVGYGNDDYNRLNIFEIDKEGNIKSTGDIENGNGITLDSLQRNKLEASQFDYLIGESQPNIHYHTNDNTLNISTEETLCLIQFLTTTATTPMFWATVPFTLSESATVTFKYYLDDVLQTDDTLQQTFNAGKNFITLFNFFNIRDNYGGILKVTMSVSNGEATVINNSIKSVLYVQGVGITAAWNGQINLVQSFNSFSLPNSKIKTMSFKNDVEVTIQNPALETIQERFKAFSLGGRGMKIIDFNENIEINNN
jgi:hypothetical protein